jgi:hypothetical protein
VQHHGIVNSETLDLAFISFWNQTLQFQKSQFQHVCDVMMFLVQAAGPPVCRVGPDVHAVMSLR